MPHNQVHVCKQSQIHCLQILHHFVNAGSQFDWTQAGQATAIVATC